MELFLDRLKGMWVFHSFSKVGDNIQKIKSIKNGTIESWQNWENMRDKDITYYAMYNIHFLETRLENDNKITLIITGYKKKLSSIFVLVCVGRL